MVTPAEQTTIDKPLVVIAGPTASGKSALAMRIAEEFSGEIVSCDSVAIYREMEIGTAKPTHDERALIPHHMIDIAWPDQPCTAGHYSRLAREALDGISARGHSIQARGHSIQARGHSVQARDDSFRLRTDSVRSAGHLPIVAGGTGLYLRALLHGLFPAPPPRPGRRERLRRIAATRGPAYLHRILRRLDPAAAEAIHVNDVPKTIRAVEVSLSAAATPGSRTRTPITVQWQQGRDALTGYRILSLGLNPPRARLYDRINQRAAEMFDRGLIEETARLLARYGADCRPLASHGYAQASAVLRGELTREQAVQQAQQAHRNYAKRQLTWFRREPAMHWLEGLGSDPDILEQAARLVQQHLLEP